jgi:hypothetical protein
LVDSEAEAWNHDSIVEFGNRFDCGLHVVGNVQGSTSTLIPEKLFEKGVFGRTVQPYKRGLLSPAYEEDHSRAWGSCKSYRNLFFGILFLSEPGFELVSLRQACYRLVSRFSIPACSPWDQRGKSCSRNHGLRIRIRAENGLVWD